MWQDKCSFFPHFCHGHSCHSFFSQLLMIFLVSFKIKAYLCSYYKIYTDMEQVEERYIFIFTPIHTKMTFMDVANTIIK